jgi:hypothetical protein
MRACVISELVFLSKEPQRKPLHTALSFERIGTYKKGKIVDTINDKFPSAGRAIMSPKILM